MTTYSGATPAQTMLDDETAALGKLSQRFRVNPALCEGIGWLRSQLAAKPAMTLAEFIPAFQAAQGDRGAWAAALMRDLGDIMHPELRAAVMAELHGDNCTMVAKHCRNRLTSVEKDQLRKQFTARETPSTDLESELK
jgi:hypothetical protein